MLRIAGPDEAARLTATELSRALHPSSGFPRRIRLTLVDPAPDGAADHHLAEVVRMDDYPPFLARRARGQRPSA